MTPDNDKTLRAIFRGVKKGYDEWNDRRDYRLKYEKDFDIGQKKHIGNIAFFVPEFPHEQERYHILHERGEGFRSPEDDEDYIMNLDRFFPEAKLARYYHFMMTFGMGKDLDGNFTNCDMCGCNLHGLNCGGKYGMCDDCENSHRENNIQKNVDIR
jgi:hypothetical protein